MNQVLQLFPPAEPVEESPGRSYAHLWRRYLETLNRYQGAINAIRSDEKARHGGEDWAVAIEAVDDYDTRKKAQKIAGRMLDRMVWLAQERFAPPGVSLKIDAASLREICPVDPYEDFNPERAWDWLETTYGGDQGETVAWHQAASEIVKAFDLERQPTLQTKSGYVVLTLRVWMESWRSKGKTLSYQSHERITKAMLALSGFARWDGRDHLSRDLYRYAGSLNTMDAVVSRAKTGFGEKGLEIVLVTFHTTYEVRLRPDLAERLQVFLATHSGSEA